MSDCDCLSMALLGILGSAHCIGMCGPLILAFPARFGGLSMHLAYHTGRIATYTAVGAVIAAFSSGIGHARPHDIDWLIRSQYVFACVAAMFLVWFGLTKLGVMKEPGWMSGVGFSSSPGFRRLSRSLGNGRVTTMLGVGACMGFLPCGLSFAAFSRVIAAPSMTSGAIMMLTFGIGTLPALLFLGTGAARLARSWQRQLDILSGMVMIAMGMSLLGHVIF